MICNDHITVSARVARLRAGIGFRHGGACLRAVGIVGAALRGDVPRNRFAMPGNQYPGGRSAAPGDDR